MRKILPVSAVTLVSALLASPAFSAKTETYNELIVLKKAVVASGTRYVGENFQIWSKGKNEFNLATISEDDAVNGRVAEDKGRTCKVNK